MYLGDLRQKNPIYYLHSTNSDYLYCSLFFCCRFGNMAFSEMLRRTCRCWGHWHLAAAYSINQQEYPWSRGFKTCFVNSPKSCSLSSSARSADTKTGFYTDNRLGVTEVSIFIFCSG